MVLIRPTQTTLVLSPVSGVAANGRIRSFRLQMLLVTSGRLLGPAFLEFYVWFFGHLCSLRSTSPSYIYRIQHDPKRAFCDRHGDRPCFFVIISQGHFAPYEDNGLLMALLQLNI